MNHSNLITTSGAAALLGRAMGGTFRRYLALRGVTPAGRGAGGIVWYVREDVERLRGENIDEWIGQQCAKKKEGQDYKAKYEQLISQIDQLIDELKTMKVEAKYLKG
jgi:hypothetical protein